MSNQKKDISSKQILTLLYHIDKFISKRKNFDIKDTVLLAGSPRSGTTWLMELFESLPEYTYLFEPLQPQWFPNAVNAGFQGRMYVPKEKNWDEGQKYLEKIFSGKLVSRLPPYDNINSIMHRLLYKKLIVKSVRITRILPWLLHHIKIRDAFFIVRHPCAVVSSQIKTGFTGYSHIIPPFNNRNPTINEIVSEAKKIDFIHDKTLNKLKKLNKIEEVLAVTWCIDNMIPLNEKKPKWSTIFYEKLVLEGEAELKSLFNRIGEENAYKTAVTKLKEPSVVTYGNDRKLIKSTDMQLSKWKKSLSEKQIDRILNVLSIFDFNLYSEEIEPIYENYQY